MMCVKVGEHHTRLDQYETAEYIFMTQYAISADDFSRIYFEQAMKWFSEHEFYAPEVTFLNHKFALLRKAQGDEIGANEYRAKVEKLYAKLMPEFTGETWLSDAEINETVILTSR